MKSFKQHITEAKSYKLFLDDIRNPPDNSWVVVRSYKEFTDTITKKGIPDTISFDHDLADFSKGREWTGMDCAKWLIDQDIVIPDFKIHSANPIGSRNITSLLNNFKKFKSK